MPLYDYKCSACGVISEVRHGFDDTHAAPCSACGGKLVRVFNPAPILFKGSGFYVTDSRSSNESANGESAPTTPAAPATPAASPTATPPAP